MAVEGLVLDGLDLQAGAYHVAEMKFTPAKKRPEWAESSDGDGSLLIRDPLFENSQWDVLVYVDASTRDLAHTAAGLITDKLEEAERQPLGLGLVWTPADSTKSLTFYVLTGEIVEIPIDVESGYFASAPRLAVRLSLTCRPFGYGAEVTVTSAAGAGPLQIFSVAGVTGDVAAEARLIVSDTATQSRDFAAWGLEYRYQAGADLLLTQPDLTATGFAGTSTTRAGSVSTNIFRGTLTTTPVAVCGTGNQPHIGTFRPYLRCYPTSTDIRVRLSYREGDGPLKSLEWETPVTAFDWNEIDLGVVSIPPKVLGTQRWQAQVEAYSDVVGDTLDVDYLILVPAGEGFGRARRPLGVATSTSFSVRDEFNQTAGALNAKSPAAGAGTWATFANGTAPTDFQVNATSHTLTRAATSEAWRAAIAGTTTLTECIVQLDFSWPAIPTSTGHVLLIARQIDQNNFIGVDVASTGVVTLGRYTSFTGGGGGFSVMGAGRVSAWVANATYTVYLYVGARGIAAAWIVGQGAPPTVPVVQGFHADAATGGTLASGKVGLAEFYGDTSASPRVYDNFAAWAPLADAVCFSGQSVEFRSDDTIRKDSTGTYYGRPTEYRGAPFYAPPAGDENRTSRVAVMMRRNDPYTLPNATVSDAQTVEVRYTPRWLYLPR